MLRRPSTLRVGLGAVARVLWYLFRVPCGWALHPLTRDHARWRYEDVVGDEEEDGDDDEKTMQTKLEALRSSLASAGASNVKHVVGTFDEHLLTVSNILKQWCTPNHVQIAGYGHTVYGSELFPVQIATFTNRGYIKSMVGKRSETLMFIYATTSQKRWYRSVLELMLDPEASEYETSRTEDDGISCHQFNHSLAAVNFYNPQKLNRTFGIEQQTFLSILHAADIVSTLKDPDLVRNENRNVSGKNKKSKQFTSYVFVITLLRHALRLCRGNSARDNELETKYPSLERSLLWTISDLATKIGVDVLSEKAIVIGLRETKNDVVLVLKCTGVV